MCEYAILGGFLIGIAFGYAFVHKLGHKDGRVEGARLRMSKETALNSPVKQDEDNSTLAKAEDQLKKQLKLKEKESGEVESLGNAIAWLLFILIAVIGMIVYGL